jgi:hypothetical protein
MAVPQNYYSGSIVGSIFGPILGPLNSLDGFAVPRLHVKLK